MLGDWLKTGVITYFFEKKDVVKTNLYERKILNTGFWKNTAVGDNFKM